MARRERRFDVVYTYYRYNSGDGQCGDRRDRISLKTRKEAVELARGILAAFAGTLDEETKHELEDRLLPSFGYLTGARVERLLIDRKEIAL